MSPAADWPSDARLRSGARRRLAVLSEPAIRGLSARRSRSNAVEHSIRVAGIRSGPVDEVSATRGQAASAEIESEKSRCAGAAIARVELLEARQLLAAVTDNGTTLTIDLAAGEVLTVASLGTSYSFTSSSSFVNGGTASATDFSGFGTTGLTLESAGLARYDSIQIVDSGAAARVIFSGSGSHAYTDSFVVLLNDNAGNGTQPGLMFNGATTFSGNAGLLAEIDTGSR